MAASIRLVAILLLVVTTSSCDLEGLTGPEGPPGPEGPRGMQGPPGAAASITSVTINLEEQDFDRLTDWSWFQGAGWVLGSARTAFIPDPRITEAVVEGGAILVFMRMPKFSPEGTYVWIPLPFRYDAFGGGGQPVRTFVYQFIPGELRIAHIEQPLGTQPLQPIPPQTFRYVIIPPGG